MKKFLTFLLFRKNNIIILLCVCVLGACTQSRNDIEPIYDVTNYKIRNEVYSFIGDGMGWKLTLETLYMTENGGVTWKEVNTGDFIKEGGSVRYVLFFDSELGFILVANDQTDGTKLYVTKDGGTTFERVYFSMEQCKGIVSNIEEYDYISIPFRNNDIIETHIKKSASDTEDVLVFESRDWGDTWTYTGMVYK